VDDVFAQVVDGLAEALDSFHRVFRGVDLRALAPAPKDEDLAAQLSRKIDGLDGLAERVAAHFGNVAGKGAVLEDRVKKEVGRPHHKREAGLLERLFKTGDDLVSFGRRGVDGHQVVVVEVDTPSADVSEHMHDVDGINGRAHFKAKGIASAVANSPKPKRETIRRSRCVLGHGHTSVLIIALIVVILPSLGISCLRKQRWRGGKPVVEAPNRDEAPQKVALRVALNRYEPGTW